MTNALVLLHLSTSLTTNWQTVSYTTPHVQPSELTLAVYRATMANQVGTIQSNLIGSFEWRGRTNEVVLESKRIAQLERSVDSRLIP